MKGFEKPVCEIIRFNNEVIATSGSCNCDFGFGPVGDTQCTNPVAGGDLPCCQAQYGGNC